MSTPLHHEAKKEFQLDCMILFKGAVFAIAITLLVIEIKVPELPEHLISEASLKQSLGHLIPKCIGFIISFMVIWLYRTIHHSMFGFVVAYTRRLLWLNLLLLLSVALMPFSTAFFSEYVLHLLRSPWLCMPATSFS